MSGRTYNSGISMLTWVIFKYQKLAYKISADVDIANSNNRKKNKPKRKGRTVGFGFQVFFLPRQS